MNTLAIAPNCSCTEKNFQVSEKEMNAQCKKNVFEWHCYLKQEKKHNIALGMFTK